MHKPNYCELISKLYLRKYYQRLQEIKVYFYEDLSRGDKRSKTLTKQGLGVLNQQIKLTKILNNDNPLPYWQIDFFLLMEINKKNIGILFDF